MKKLNASDITWGIAKAGDVVKGKGKGDMNTGIKVITGALLTAGALIGSAATAIIKKK